MPGPAVYVVVVVGTVAAGFAFKHFVYDPHIAPKVDVWKHEFRTRREARRRRRQGPIPVAVALNGAREDRVSNDSRSDDSDDPHVDKQTYELEDMVQQEVLDWRNGVDQAATLRRRTPRNVEDLSIASGSSTSWSLPQDVQRTVDPVPSHHVLFDSSSEATSTIPSRQSSPMRSPQVSTLRSSTSQSTLRSPLRRDTLLVETEVLPPTPAGTNFSLTESDGRSYTVGSGSSSAAGFSSPNLVPSLSLLHPVDLDREHDVELLSAPSSRPDSPFSALSQPSSIGGFSAGSHEGRTSHLASSPPLPPLPGIVQLLPPPNSSQPPASSPQALSEMSVFYQTPPTTIPSSLPTSRSQSELEFLSFDGSSTRSLSSDNISSMSSRDRMSVQSLNATDDEGFDDMRDVRSDFGGSELSVESSWSSLSDPGSGRGAPQARQ